MKRSKSKVSLLLLCAGITIILPTNVQVSAFVLTPMSTRSTCAANNNNNSNNPLFRVNAADAFSSNQPLQFYPTGSYSSSFSSSTSLSLSNKDNNEEEKDEEKDPSSTPQKIKSTIQQSYKKALTKFLNFIPTLKVAVSSFTVGIVLAFTLIFVPVYNSVDKMSEPVTLFETILTDLDQGYVDAVDTKKLFETGVNAMLNSLDPYTEFEGRQEAKDMSEGISGKYAGVGLVISGASLPQDVLDEMNKSVSSTTNGEGNVSQSKQQKGQLLPQDAINDNARFSNTILDDDEDIIDADDDDFDRAAFLKRKNAEKRANLKAYERGVRVVSAFEGYAFDAGMRPGDKIVAVDDFRLKPGTPVEEVRSKLRGEPGTSVQITFERDGLKGEQTLSLPRNIVQVNDVKLTTFVGKPQDGIGYIQLTGFNANAGAEVRRSIFALQQASEQASNGEHSLQGLILDLRGNPGGLLTSAVDVSSLLVPKGSEIVSAKGRGFPGVSYRSRVDPILDPNTKLAVLINDSTASAAEIVSGAVQDLDVGVIVGGGRSFGKGLVQNVEELPFDTALKFTVAKYYTPSGRCIQSTNYAEGGGSKSDGGKYKASKVAEKDKMVFYTKNGREVKDGGGIAADYKVAPPKASALEVTLLRSGVISDFASEWSKKNTLTNDFEIDDVTYRDFQQFVMQRQKEGDLKLDALYAGPIEDLTKALKLSGYKGSTREVEQLRTSIMSEMRKDFDKYKVDIKEDIGTGILSRYLPESMLIERSIKSDKQVLAAAKLVGGDDEKFNSLLARENSSRGTDGLSTGMASSENALEKEKGAKLSVKW